MSVSVRLHPMVRGAAVLAALGIVVALGTACQPEPGPSASPSSESTPSSTPRTPSASPTPTPMETNLPDAGFALPERCEDIYSAEMLASLGSAAPPLNDPGVTMNATQNVDALELLTSGIPTIRCSWGGPSEYGLATNVSVVDAARTAALLDALRAAGFGCESAWEGTLCQIEQRTVDLDDNEVALGESHFVRGDGWVTTAWVNFAPEGYTEDIVSTLWG
jgi:hypothetical protein